MKLEQLDAHISELETSIKNRQAELAAAKAFRPFLVKFDQEHSSPATAPVESQPPLIPARPTLEGYGATIRNVRTAIAACPQEYTVYNVEQQLTAMGSTMAREAISQALSRLSKTKEIKIHKRGIGRAPSIYRKEAGAS